MVISHNPELPPLSYIPPFRAGLACPSSWEPFSNPADSPLWEMITGKNGVRWWKGGGEKISHLLYASARYARFFFTLQCKKKRRFIYNGVIKLWNVRLWQSGILTILKLQHSWVASIVVLYCKGSCKEDKLKGWLCHNHQYFNKNCISTALYLSLGCKSLCPLSLISGSLNWRRTTLQFKTDICESIILAQTHDLYLSLLQYARRAVSQLLCFWRGRRPCTSPPASLQLMLWLGVWGWRVPSAQQKRTKQASCLAVIRRESQSWSPCIVHFGAWCACAAERACREQWLLSSACRGCRPCASFALHKRTPTTVHRVLFVIQFIRLSFFFFCD